MLFSDEVGDFALGAARSSHPIKMAPPGPPPLCTVLSDPQVTFSKCNLSVRKWKRVHRLSSDGSSRVAIWSSNSADGKSEKVSEMGEEDLVPAGIPDEVWQTHFRNNDAEELYDKKEVELILSLYKQCSGRWPVIYDRWQMHPVYGPRGKSIEAIKSKFSKVIMRLLEIDLFSKKRPTTSMEKLHASRSLKYLPIFSMKFNEKNEYLRRLFLDNEFKRKGITDLSVQTDKYKSDLVRGPSLAMKFKKGSRPTTSPVSTTPGPHLVSGLIQSVHSEIALSESNRIKSVLKAIGINRSDMLRTPHLTRLLAIVEREAHALIMMRDSLQRKKQELEILKSAGTNRSAATLNHLYNISNRPRIGSAGSIGSQQTSVAQSPALPIAPPVIPNMNQKKRKI